MSDTGAAVGVLGHHKRLIGLSWVSRFTHIKTLKVIAGDGTEVEDGVSVSPGLTVTGVAATATQVTLPVDVFERDGRGGVEVVKQLAVVGEGVGGVGVGIPLLLLPLPPDLTLLFLHLTDRLTPALLHTFPQSLQSPHQLLVLPLQLLQTPQIRLQIALPSIGINRLLTIHILLIDHFDRFPVVYFVLIQVQK